MSETPGNGDLALAERLNELFETMPRAADLESGRSRRRWTNDEVAEAIKQKHPQLAVSGAYLSQLRRGVKRRPSLDLLRALAEHFGVSVEYLINDGAAGSSEAALIAARLTVDHQVRHLAARASHLTPAGLAAALSVVETLLEAENPGRRQPPAQA